MRIDTKYDVGQAVWYIDRKWAPTPCNICEQEGSVLIKGHAFMCPACRGNKNIMDETKQYEALATTVMAITVTEDGLEYQCDRTFGFGEDDIYPTEALAQAECDRRNASG